MNLIYGVTNDRETKKMGDGLSALHKHDHHRINFRHCNGRYFNFDSVGFHSVIPVSEESLLNKSVYGNLPFMAPEVLRSRYSYVGILSGEPPFIDREYDQF